MTTMTEITPFPVTGVDTSKPELLFVRLDQLVVDHENYQRAPVESYIRRLVKSWDWALFGEPEVNVRDDCTVSVIDGQHRVEAAKRVSAGDTIVRVRAHYGLTLEQEQRRFLAHNFYIRRATKGDTFAARLSIGEPVAVQVQTLCEELGFSLYVGIQRTQLNYGQLASGSLEEAISSNGYEATRVALIACTHAWGHQWKCTGPFLRGLVAFVNAARKDGKFSLARLGEVMAPQTVEGITLLGKREASRRAVFTPTGISLVMRDMYNRKLGASKRLEGLDFIPNNRKREKVTGDE